MRALKMQFVGLPQSEALVSTIHDHAAQLGARYPSITDLSVTVEERAPRKYERKQFNVRLGLRKADCEVVVNREHDRDPNAALREAFDAAARQLTPGTQH